MSPPTRDEPHAGRTPRRVSVVGTSGSGKTTLARQLASALGAPHLELDAVNHQAGWKPLPPDEFTSRVGSFVAADTWVVDGNYSSVLGDVVWARADTVVWIDLPRAKVMRQLIWRSIMRVVRREELWNGNRETLRNLLSWDPTVSIVRWSWTSHGRVRERNRSAIDDERWAHLHFVRLTSRADQRAYLRSLAPPPLRPA